MARLLLLVLLFGGGCTTRNADSSLATMEDLNDLLAVVTGNESAHQRITAGFESARASVAEQRRKADTAYRTALAQGKTTEEAKAAADEANRIGIGGLFGLVGAFVTGFIGYRRRSKTRVPQMVDTTMDTLDHLGMLTNVHQEKLRTVKAAVIRGKAQKTGG